MKIQYLAVVLVIIIVPISIVMSGYIQNQIEAIEMQTKLDNNLINATYDAVKAFQLNTTNNKYSSLSDSKIRDIEASVNTFYNSLLTSMYQYAASKEDLEAYIPALLYTLYDGYYIYSSSRNVYSTTGEDENVQVDIDLDPISNYDNRLKPFVYYSAKYRLNNGNIIIVNYTLDNAITVYGDFGSGYETRSGYLINPDLVTEDNGNSLNYDGVTIEKGEQLTEHLLFYDPDDPTSSTSEGDFSYIYYGSDKYYQDKDDAGNPLYYDTEGRMITDISITGIPVLFRYDNYIKAYVNDNDTLAYARDCEMKSNSAYDYYKEAKDFSEWVVDNLGGVTQTNMLKMEDGTTNIDDNYLSENTGGTHIFDTREDNNNPLLSSSTFNNHRLAVIRKSIETNLTTVINRYQSSTYFNYEMPIISDDDWYSILNNVSMVSFMQGMSIGYRVYNNYAVITNNVNKEVVNTNNIYIVTDDGTDTREYHQPGCKYLLEGIQDGSLSIAGVYPTTSFQRQSIRTSENPEDDLHYYLQAKDDHYIVGCYHCIVNSTTSYDIDDIIDGNALVDFANSTENGGDGTPTFEANNSAYVDVRRRYLTALARERNDLYKLNFDITFDDSYTG